jgi:hypothetical protein
MVRLQYLDAGFCSYVNNTFELFKYIGLLLQWGALSFCSQLVLEREQITTLSQRYKRIFNLLIIS